jgi:hypothetical protein
MNRELTSAEAWMMDLDLDTLSDREIAEVRRYFELMPPPPNFGKIRALSEKLRACEDIVHGWDALNAFGWWKEAFEALAPPPEPEG